MRSTLITLNFLCIGILCHGQFSPQKYISGCKVCGSHDFLTVDINNDGLPDIVVRSPDENKIIWYENEGEGAFSNEKIIEERSSYYAVGPITSFDYENDGDQDLLIDYYQENLLVWFINDGNAIFEERITISYDGTSFSSVPVLIPADINGDNKADILGVEIKGGVFLSQSNGEYVLENIDSEFIFGNDQIKAFDWQEDGDLDFMFDTNEDDLLSFYERTEIGFIYHTVEVNNLGEIVFFDFADLDNDGVNEFVFLSEGSGSDFQLGYIIISDNGQFSSPIILDNGLESEDFILVDWDQDEDVDILFTNSADDEVGYYDNTNSAFSWQGIEINTRLGSPLVATDIENDGDLDLVFINTYRNSLFLVKQTNLNNYSTSEIGGFLTNESIDIITYDFDQDNDNDLIITYLETDGNVFYFENMGDNLYAAPVALEENSTGGFSYYLVTAGYFDEDENLDLMTCSTDWLIMFTGDGAGSFSAPDSILQTPYPIGDLKAQDLNGDDRLDLVLVGSGEIVVMLGISDGSYEQVLTVPQSAFGASIVELGDLDGDGDTDLIYSEFFNLANKTSWLANDGEGNFSEPQVISGAGATTLQMIDVNMDGQQDLVVTLHDTGRLGWYGNNGNNTWQFNPWVFENGDYYYYDGIMADFDGDDFLDLLTVGFQGTISSHYSTLGNNKDARPQYLKFYRGNGNGFAPAITLSDKIRGSRFGPWHGIKTADLDSNGDLDILVYAQDNTRISWIENVFDYPTISGITYWDQNENGLVDGEDRNIPNIRTTLFPAAVSSYTDQEGRFKYYVDTGEYELVSSADSCWSPVTILPIPITVDEEAVIENIGFLSSGTSQSFTTNISSSLTRCFSEVPFWVTVVNEGCSLVSGELGLIMDENVTLLSSSIEADILDGDTIFWSFIDLLPYETFTVKLVYLMPSEEFTGDVLNFTSFVKRSDGSTEPQLEGVYHYLPVLLCSGDPNDKQVNPARAPEYAENYLLPGEELYYNIRFQNVGNDTAFTVIIKDTLDVSLDWSTFRPIVASHLFETALSAQGEVTFTFQNINLPDSTTNQQGSNGFVRYSISLIAEIEENTSINNQANIYFDFNSPIATNTINNVFVTELPTPDNTDDLVSNVFVEVYPVPSSKMVNFKIVSSHISWPRINLFDQYGRKILDDIFINDRLSIDMGNHLAGLYYYVIVDKQGRKLTEGKIIKM